MPLIAIVAFIVVFAAVLIAISMGMKFYETRRRRNVSSMLQTVAGPTVATTTKLLKDLEPARPSGIERLMKSFDFTRKSGELIAQAGLDWTPAGLLTAMGAAAAAGIVAGLLVPNLFGRVIQCLLLAPALAVLPYLYIRRRVSARMAEMEEQLPGSAGLSGAFDARRACLHHQPGNAGVRVTGPSRAGVPHPVQRAEPGSADRCRAAQFKHPCAAAGCAVLQFFGAAAAADRGNLSEILTRLAYLIRERFRLKGQVKAASAHGRMTALVLTMLPVLTMLGLMVVSPAYLQVLARDHDGRIMIGAAVFAMLLGNYSIKKIVNIKV